MEENKLNDEFNSFYSNYTDKINEYYIKLSNAKKKNITLMILLDIILLALFIYGFAKIDFSNVAGFLICSYILFVIASIIIAIVCLRTEKQAISESIISDAVKFISKDENGSYAHKLQISKKNIEEMELFDLNRVRYSGKNCIQAIYKGNPMSFADMVIYYLKDRIVEEKVYDEKGNEYIRRKVVKDKKYIFDGSYISATLNKRIAEHIYLIPNNFNDVVLNSRINDYITFDGEKIELENLEFSKKYRVYSTDEIQARYILSLSLMEKINNIDDVFENKKYIVFKEGRRFVICLDDFKIEKLRNTFIPLNRNSDKLKENIYYIFKNIYNLFYIYDILDLGNDLYV